ncbi:multisynthetase complex auxiliary component p43, putative [Eimeria praecox]|uniref:Multisynthetase complex auxiliary component p43, putative n=1 Tax=Eimeria praecox TaxID=51316 RepID=U6G0X1_9EIME|nr:multisynthetase complex auxiliary component p43, putative [Eimeria praecox]
MEFVYPIGMPGGGACALVASYAFPPGVVTISGLGSNAAKTIGQVVRLYTPDGEFEEPATIIRYLCSKSEAKSILLGPEKNVDEQAAINQWLSFCASRGYEIVCSNDLNEFNSALEKNTFLCGNNLTAADLVGMASVYTSVQQQQQHQQQQQQHQQQQQQQQQQQHFDGYVDLFAGIKEQRVQDFTSIELPIKTKAAKGSAAAATAAAAAAAERPIDDPMRLDMRVGLVKKVWRHPEADKLYCEEIDFGSFGVRRIASGLVNYLEQTEFEGKKVVVLFNLKQKALRGFDSHGMVLCANTPDKLNVQLLEPHPDTPLGERVVVEGLTGEPDEVLSSKKGKDTLAAVSPFLTTKDDCLAYFKDKRLVTPQGPVRCKSIKGGYIS